MKRPSAGERGHLPGDSQDPLQDADDKEKHKSEHNDSDKNKLPQWLPPVAPIGEITPVPQIWVIRIGRHRTDLRGHDSSVDSVSPGKFIPTWLRRAIVAAYCGTLAGAGVAPY